MTTERRFDPVKQAESHILFRIDNSGLYVKTIGEIKSTSPLAKTDFRGWAYGDSTKARDSICTDFAYKYLYI